MYPCDKEDVYICHSKDGVCHSEEEMVNLYEIIVVGKRRMHI